MSELIDRMEFERLEPTCDACGEYLTFNEWLENDGFCDTCYANLYDESYGKFAET